MRRYTISDFSQNVIVTGGAGYIGSHASKALYNAGYNPITVDNLSTGWSEAVKFGPLEIVDLLDRQKIEQVLQKYNPVAVMHFAAFSQVSESVSDPVKYWNNNVVGSLNLFQACISQGCDNIIFSSTCATYGNHDNLVLTETSAQQPMNAYGASKRATEEMLQQISNSSGLNYVIFRYFNVAGADPEGDLGEFHQPETHLIPLLFDAIEGKRDSITIFGSDYDTPDGTCVRDYVHVCDLVDAHVLGLKWLENGCPNRIFNLGTGLGFSVRDIIDHVGLVTSREVPVTLGARRPGDCAKLVSSSELAHSELGWEAKKSSLREIIADGWRWHQKDGYQK